MNLVLKLKNMVWKLMVLALLATNVLTITNAKFYDLIYGMLAHIPYQNLLVNSKTAKLHSLTGENQRLKSQALMLEEQAKLHKAKLAKAQGISRNIVRRVARNVTMNVTSVLGESLPYIGIGLIVSATAADIYDGCQTIKDTNEMLTLFGESADVEQQDKVCGLQIPSVNEVSQYAGEYTEKAQQAMSEWLKRDEPTTP